MFEAHVAGIGEHNVYNSLAAVAVGRIVGLSEYQMQKGLAEYKGTAMRQELLRMGPYTFINDAYNANPASMTEAVRSLALLTKGRKLLVLGGMLELGDWTQQEHEKIGREIAEEGMDILITLGEPAGYIAAAARQSGMKNVYTVTTHEEAAQRLQSVIKPGDTVLVKGSRGFKMEKILPYFERK
jgi:UDP-N-acetylmuramoyl-tripeptide--D-alanyl-D-alanine ligase